MKKNIFHNIFPWIGLILFVLALRVLHTELKAYHYHDVVASLRSIPGSRLAIALLLTGLSYFLLTFYDFLALRHIRHPLEYRKTAVAAFVGYTFSYNLGTALITGSSVRFRLYTAWGLSSLEILKIIVFCSLTFWIGFFAVGSAVFLLDPFAIPGSLHLPLLSVRPLGLIFLFILTGYLLTGIIRNAPFKIREVEFQLPSSGTATLQVIVSSLDWILAGAVLYILLSVSLSLSFASFLGVFLLAQIAGVSSQIPGGLGVFEMVMTVFLTPYAPASGILAPLLAYRGIYYLLPFCVSISAFGVNELIQRREKLQRVTGFLSQWVPVVAPHIITFIIFIGGIVLLLSGATPPVGSRMSWLREFLPLSVVEISHFMGSIAGVLLLILARGLQQRLDAAYLLTQMIIGVGIIFSLFKGFDYEEGIILTFMFGALLLSRKYFHRKASLFSARFSAGWNSVIVLVLLSSLWLALFAFKHVEYSHDLWWQFAFEGDAPRALRATVGAAGIFLFFSIAQLFKPSVRKEALPSQEELDAVQALVIKSKESSANLALLGDKMLLYSDSGNAFIMYGVEGMSWVSMGDPVGPDEDAEDLIWKFREMSHYYGGRSVFYEVGQRHLHLYIDLGYSLLKIGEEARAQIGTFSLDGGSRKDMRHLLHKLEKEGYTFEIVPAEGMPSLLPEFKTISDIWLAGKNTREKGFSLGFYNEEYLKRLPAAVIKRENRVTAFANIWSSAEKEELSIDLMRYAPDTAHGIMDYLFIHLIMWGGKEGYRWFNLGMSPLSGLEGHALVPVWNRLGSFIFRHGEHFYNFQGVRQFKEKFDPVWQPKYLASPGGFALPHILTNIASLVSGGIKGVVAK